jgi:hypothetical protein
VSQQLLNCVANSGQLKAGLSADGVIRRFFGALAFALIKPVIELGDP